MPKDRSDTTESRKIHDRLTELAGRISEAARHLRQLKDDYHKLDLELRDALAKEAAHAK